jgi:hypothetical protein
MVAVIFVFQNNKKGIKILIICKINKFARPKWAADNKKHKIMGNIFKNIFILFSFHLHFQARAWKREQLFCHSRGNGNLKKE